MFFLLMRSQMFRLETLALISKSVRIFTSFFLILSLTACSRTDSNLSVKKLDSLSAGTSHTCQLKPSGKAFCWGRNDAGQLGDDSFNFSRQPVAVKMPSEVSGFVSLDSGKDHNCALTKSGDIYCWGDNTYGQLGNGSHFEQNTPIKIDSPKEIKFALLSLNNYHSCALTRDGFAYCWGLNNYGQLGNNTNKEHLTPTSVRMPRSIRFKSLALGAYHTCGLSKSGQPYCWGANAKGQLGDNSLTDRFTPVSVQMPNRVSSFSMLSLGFAHSCALTEEGRAFCWGQNNHGQLGVETLGESLLPISVSMPSRFTFSFLTSGAYHNCGLTSSDQAYCWGYNLYGQLGNGTQASQFKLSLVVFAEKKPLGVLSLGENHSCALTNTNANETYCWGQNHDGQLGDGTIQDKSKPIKVTL